MEATCLKMDPKMPWGAHGSICYFRIFGPRMGPTWDPAWSSMEQAWDPTWGSLGILHAMSLVLHLVMLCAGPIGRPYWSAPSESPIRSCWRVLQHIGERYWRALLEGHHWRALLVCCSVQRALWQGTLRRPHGRALWRGTIGVLQWTALCKDCLSRVRFFLGLHGESLLLAPLGRLLASCHPVMSLVLHLVRL